jgi:hypothetical protein
MAQVDVRKGMPWVELSRQEFEKRYRLTRQRVRPGRLP